MCQNLRTDEDGVTVLVLQNLILGGLLLTSWVSGSNQKLTSRPANIKKGLTSSSPAETDTQETNETRT